jgi:hypothetical protein
MNLMRLVSLAVLCVTPGSGRPARKRSRPSGAQPEAGAKSEGTKVHGHCGC